MPKKSPPLDDLRKLDGELEEGCFLVIEDNLRLMVKKGKKIFEARYRKKGIERSQQIGTHPDTPIEEVRANKRRFLEECEAEFTKTNPPEDAPVTKRKSRHEPGEEEDGSRYCLKTEAHCWQFIRNLCFTYVGIAREYQLAILLMLALPAKPKDLLNAKRSDIDSLGRLVLGKERLQTASPYERSYGLAPPKRFAWISPTCNLFLDELKSLAGKNEHFFPSLAEMSPQERRNKLNSILEDVWTLYPVRISGLQFTFAKLAKEYSEFNPEFIDALLTKKYKIAAPHQVFYDFQAKAILAWWGSNLERLLSMDSYVSKHDFRSMEFEFKLYRPTYMLI